LPTLEIELEDLEALLGMPLPKNKDNLNEILAFIKGEIKDLNDKNIRIELKDSNRVDLWGVEGLARALCGFLNIDNGLIEYQVIGDSDVEVQVNSRLRQIRPYIGCAVVRDIQLSNMAIRNLMHFQEKLDTTYGRNRRKTSIGLYDFDLISPPLYYDVVKPNEISFVPLDFNEELTLEEILRLHPKGIEYGDIVRQYPFWPIFTDSEKKVLSFPPIINSNDLGKITEDTNNVLIEVTGTVLKTVLNTLTNLTVALADRGGSIYSTIIHYPYKEIKDITTPILNIDTFEIDRDYIQKVIGIEMKLSEISSLLEKARYAVAKTTGSQITVRIPSYRVDIQHPIDIIEDIAITYDYNKIQPRWPHLPTIGGVSSKTTFRDLVREIVIGLGFQEILTFNLTNSEVLFTRMNIKPERLVEMANPRLASMTSFRNWLLPSLLEFLSDNIHVEYPQKIFEIGHCITYDEKESNKIKEMEKLSCISIHSNANFSEVKSILDALFRNLNINYKLESFNHGSLIKGRSGKILVEENNIGFIAEIHPQVLRNWNLENPAISFELNLDIIYETLF
jgi:phenylalanyl-tRNA synthetase beta chain